MHLGNKNMIFNPSQMPVNRVTPAQHWCTVPFTSLMKNRVWVGVLDLVFGWFIFYQNRF